MFGSLRGLYLWPAGLTALTCFGVFVFIQMKGQNFCETL